MLKIGEFSVLTGISINMLRNYDKIGLLKPEMVDSISKYRLYSDRQIIRANRIQVLKSLGFTLKEISQILLDDDTLDSRVSTFLEGKIREKQKSLSIIEKQILQMQQVLNDLGAYNGLTLSVSIKRFPAHKFVSLRGIIRDFNEEGLLWERHTRACITNKVKLADVPYCMAVTHSVDLKRKLIDTEVSRVVEQIGPNADELRFSEMPETEAAVVAFKGAYSQISDINNYIYSWIEKNGYRISGKAFNIYYKSPENESNPENYITEICYPIKHNT